MEQTLLVVNKFDYVAKFMLRWQFGCHIIIKIR
jgi:hypothetical protein